MQHATTTDGIEIVILTLTGIFGFVSHAMACGACLYARIMTKPPRRRRFRGFWLAAAMLFAGLAVIELLGVPGACRVFFKMEALGSGHYGERRGFQAELILAIVVPVMVLALGLVYRFREALRHSFDSRLVSIAAIGTSGHLALLAVSLISLHGIDQIFMFTKANWLMFGGCTAMVVYAGVRFGLRRPNPRPLTAFMEQGLTDRELMDRHFTDRRRGARHRSKTRW